MSIAEKLTTIAENVPKVFDAGKDALWDVIQCNGTRTSYMYAFHRWNSEYIRPKYKVVPTEQGLNQTFYRNSKLKKIEAEYFDFSQIPATTNTNYGNYYTFQFCSALEEIEDIGMPDSSYTGTFHSCGNLHTIKRLRVNENTTFTSSPFSGCTALQNITIDGTIGQNGFNLQWSAKLSAKSIISIIKALSSTTSGLTVTLSKTAVDNIDWTATEYGSFENLAATKQDWNIALL